MERNSVYVAHLGTIPLYVHPTALLLVVVVWLNFGSGVPFTVPLAMIIVLAMAIILHELGHGLAAMYYGARNITITLWAFGGQCSSHGDPKPGQHIVILAAGPAVSFLLSALGMLAIWALTIHMPTALYAHASSFQTVQGLAEEGGLLKLSLLCMNSPMVAGNPFQVNTLGMMLGMTVIMNLVLGIFNMLPIFPLDGGQITYNIARIVRPHGYGAAHFTLSVAVIFAAGVVLYLLTPWPDRLPVYSLVIIGFLVYNAFRYLR